jgi:hypothetical protein
LTLAAQWLRVALHLQQKQVCIKPFFLICRWKKILPLKQSNFTIICFFTLLFVILENELKGKAHEVDDFKENSLLCIICRITAYRKKYFNLQLPRELRTCQKLNTLFKSEV